MREVQLTRGLVALIDDDDFPVIAPFTWQAVICDRRLYARRTVPVVERRGGSSCQYMHALLTGWPLVDHINGDGLDNRRANLRSATPAQNVRNARKRSTASSSRFKGASLYRRTGRWRAYIDVGGKEQHLGYFATEIDAARAYDAAALHHFGEFARLNFPKEYAHV